MHAATFGPTPGRVHRASITSGSSFSRNEASHFSPPPGLACSSLAVPTMYFALLTCHEKEHTQIERERVAQISILRDYLATLYTQQILVSNVWFVLSYSSNSYDNHIFFHQIKDVSLCNTATMHNIYSWVISVGYRSINSKIEFLHIFHINSILHFLIAWSA